MNIYQKLVEVEKSVRYLKKENSGHQYNYVSSSQVLGSIKAKMEELGLLLIPKVVGHQVTADTVENKDKYDNTKRTTTYFTELDLEFIWVNSENPSETITVPWYGQGVDIAGEKGVGKALTYAEKYFMLKFFHIPTDKDDPDAFQEKYEDEKPAPKAKGKAIPQKDNINWPAFWVNVKQLGYTEEEVYKIAGTDKLTDWPREDINALYKDLKTRKQELNFLGEERQGAK